MNCARGKNLASDLRRPPGGFTIMELLAVVAVLGILTVMILSVASAVRTRGREDRTRADLKILEAQIEAFNEKAGTYPADARQKGTFPEAWQSTWNQVEKRSAAQENFAWLLVQLERYENIRSVIRENFPSSRCGTPDLNLDQPGDPQGYLVVNDDFRSNPPNTFNYQQDGGPGGTPVVISAGADGVWDTADDLRSDDRMSEE